MEVVNIEDGRRLGKVIDVDVDFDSCAIKGIVVRVSPSYCGSVGFRREITIPVERVVRFGCDIIIIRAENERITKLIEKPRRV